MKKKSNRNKLSVYLPDGLYDWVLTISDELEIPVSATIRRSLKLLKKEYEIKGQSPSRR